MVSQIPIIRWLTTTFILIAVAVMASPVGISSRVPKAPPLDSALIDTYEQLVGADHASGSLVIGRDDSATAVTTSDGINTAIVQTSAVYSHERFRERNANSNGSPDLLNTYSVPDSNAKPEQINLGPGPEDISDDSGITEYKSEDCSLIQQPTDTKLVRTTMGYHNYALVCADSKVHTDYCANGRRGYYCSQSGYVQVIPGGTRYLPCEEQCICMNIGVKPACFQFYAGPGTVTCPVKDET